MFSLSTFHWMKERPNQDSKAASAPFSAHAMAYQKETLTHFVAFSLESRGGHFVGKSSVTQIPLGRTCMQELDCAYPIHHFGSHFRIVIFLYRNRFPDTMLIMAAVVKPAATSKFDLSCRPLSAQRAFTANTRDATTNIMSQVVWSSVRLVYPAFVSTFHVTTRKL